MNVWVNFFIDLRIYALMVQDNAGGFVRMTIRQYV
jgi:hypothetical protein